MPSIYVSSSSLLRSNQLDNRLRVLRTCTCRTSISTPACSSCRHRCARFPFPRPRGQHRSILFIVSKLPVSVAPPFLARAIPAATVLRASRRPSLSCRLGFLFFRKPWISSRWVPFRLGSSPVLDGSNRRPFPDESQAISLSIGFPSLFAWVGSKEGVSSKWGVKPGGVEFQPSVGSFFSRFRPPPPRRNFDPPDAPSFCRITPPSHELTPMRWINKG